MPISSFLPLNLLSSFLPEDIHPSVSSILFKLASSLPHACVTAQTAFPWESRTSVFSGESTGRLPTKHSQLICCNSIYIRLSNRFKNLIRSAISSLPFLCSRDPTIPAINEYIEHQSTCAPTRTHGIIAIMTTIFGMNSQFFPQSLNQLRTDLFLQGQ